MIILQLKTLRISRAIFMKLVSSFQNFDIVDRILTFLF